MAGKNLDAAGLRAAFAACVATPENDAKKVAELRFKVSPCHTRGAWLAMLGTSSLPRHHPPPICTTLPLIWRHLPPIWQVGDRVECNMEGGVRKAGVVSQLMWRDEEMEQGQVCPYKVAPHSLDPCTPIATLS